MLQLRLAPSAQEAPAEYRPCHECRWCRRHGRHRRHGRLISISRDTGRLQIGLPTASYACHPGTWPARGAVMAKMPEPLEACATAPGSATHCDPKAVSVVEKIPQLRPRPRLRHPLRCGYGKNARTDRHQAAGKVVRRRTTSRGRRESVVAILPEQIRHQAAGRTRPFGDVRPTRQPIPHCVSLDTVSGDT